MLILAHDLLVTLSFPEVVTSRAGLGFLFCRLCIANTCARRASRLTYSSLEHPKTVLLLLQTADFSNHQRSLNSLLSWSTLLCYHTQKDEDNLKNWVKTLLGAKVWHFLSVDLRNNINIEMSVLIRLLLLRVLSLKKSVCILDWMVKKHLCSFLS